MPFVLEISLSAISILTGQKKRQSEKKGQKYVFLDTWWPSSKSVKNVANL